MIGAGVFGAILLVRELGLTRGRVRAVVGTIGQAFLRELRALAQQAKVSPADLVPFLHDTCQALDRDGA